MTEASIEQGPGTQHGAQHRQQPIGHAAQGPSMRMPAGTQLSVVLTADGFVLHTHPRPMIGGVAQPRIAAVAHLHAAMLAALPGPTGPLRHTRAAHGNLFPRGLAQPRPASWRRQHVRLPARIAGWSRHDAAVFHRRWFSLRPVLPAALRCAWPVLPAAAAASASAERAARRARWRLPPFPAPAQNQGRGVAQQLPRRAAGAPDERAAVSRCALPTTVWRWPHPERLPAGSTTTVHPPADTAPAVADSSAAVVREAGTHSDGSSCPALRP